jgi:predicted amidophosphoribosyltransferase
VLHETEGQFDLVVSVPPIPGQRRDRFSVARQRIADLVGATPRADLLTMRFDVPAYRSLPAARRANANRGRFACRGHLRGERIVLVEDVVFSPEGGQAQTCATQLTRAGAGAVIVLAAADARPLLAPETTRGSSVRP